MKQLDRWVLLNKLPPPAQWCAEQGLNLPEILSPKSSRVVGGGFASFGRQLKFRHRGRDKFFDPLERGVFLSRRADREAGHVGPPLQRAGAEQLARHPPDPLHTAHV